MGHLTIQQLETLHKKATKEPWFAGGEHGVHHVHIKEGAKFVEFDSRILEFIYPYSRGDNRGHDKVLIADLRNNLPTLITQLKLAKEIAKFYGGSKPCRFCLDGKIRSRLLSAEPPTKCGMCGGRGRVLMPNGELANDYLKKYGET